MHINRFGNDENGCVCWEDQIPEYVEAALRGAAEAAPFGAMRRHLATCTDCAAQYAELLAIVRWREAEVPFNRGVLPAPLGRFWDRPAEGAMS